MERIGRVTGLLAFLLCLQVSRGNMFDPCSGIPPVSRGDAFPIGLALIPGGNATDLALRIAADSNVLGLCNRTFQDYLISNFSARIAVFNLRIDRLQVLRMPYPDIIFPMANAPQPTMTVVAFRNNINSPPVYLASGLSSPTIGGAGFVVSLALLANFDKGLITNLYWYDLTCNACGGRTSQICIQQIGVASCATPFINCTCIDKGSNCSYADPSFQPCSTSVNVGFMGTDVHGTAFRTGAQVQRLNAYSLTSLFYKAKDFLVTQYNQIYGNITAQWNQLSQDSKNQQLDFGGSLGGSGSTPGPTGTPPPLPPPNPPPSPLQPPPPPPSPLPPGFGG